MALIMTKKLISCAIIPLLLPAMVFAGSGFLEFFFQPFEFLSFTAVYDQYSAIIDLFIFMLIFVGLTKAALGRHFPGKSGRAISIGTGLILAISLVIAEEAYDFNIKTFGPVAAAVLILTFGVMIYLFLHKSGLGMSGSAALAYIAIYFSLHAVTPEAFLWTNEVMPYFNISALLLLLIAIFGFGASFWPGHVNRASYKHPKGVGYKDPFWQKHKDAAKNEEKFIKRQIKPISKKSVKDSKSILNDLKYVNDGIQKYGYSDKARHVISRQIDKILPKEHELARAVSRLKELNERILKFDSSLLNESSREQLKKMSNGDKAKLKASMKDELKRIGAEKRIREIDSKLEKRLNVLSEYLGSAKDSLVYDQVDKALDYIKKAISIEKENKTYLKEVKRMEIRIMRLIRKNTSLAL
jgi:hypothetical protein